MSHQPASELSPDAAVRQLDRLGRRRRWQRAIARLADSAVIFFVALSLGVWTHRLWPLPPLVREAMFDLTVAMAIARSLPAAARLMRPDVDRLAVARQIERDRPQFQQRLTTWLSCQQRAERSVLSRPLERTVLSDLEDSTIWKTSGRLKRVIGWRLVAAAGALILTMMSIRLTGTRWFDLLPPWR